MARKVRKSGMKEVPLSEVKDDLSRYLREAETQEIVITRHGKPAGVLIGFESEEDWFEYRLEHDPRFLRRIEQARDSLRAGRGVSWGTSRRNKSCCLAFVEAPIQKLFALCISWTTAQGSSATCNVAYDLRHQRTLRPTCSS
jgi:prevent-host-death family protein